MSLRPGRVFGAKMRRHSVPEWRNVKKLRRPSTYKAQINEHDTGRCLRYRRFRFYFVICSSDTSKQTEAIRDEVG